MLRYHTFYTEYSGATPEEVVQALYADARLGTGLSFDGWWQYQCDLWAAKYGLSVPPPHEEGAARRLIDILLDVGALEA